MIWGFFTMVLFSATVLLLLMFIACLILESDLAAPVFVAGIVLAVVGWVMLGNSVPMISVKRIEIAKVLSTPTSIILTIEDKPVLTLNEVKYYNFLVNKTNTEIYRRGSVNMYGTTNWHDYIYILPN